MVNNLFVSWHSIAPCWVASVVVTEFASNMVVNPLRPNQILVHRGESLEEGDVGAAILLTICRPPTEIGRTYRSVCNYGIWTAVIRVNAVADALKPLD